jgi:hypothetical protein
VTNSWRALPKAGLAGDQRPVGVWTGKRYIVFAGRGAAAYDPARNGWRRIRPAPVRAATAVWSGSAVYLTTASRRALSYDPAKDRWHELPLLPRGRIGTVTTWDGVHLLVWGGARGGASLVPGAKRWTPFARGPLPARLESTAVWTGSTLLVWGGVPTKTWGHDAAAGAAYTPPPVGCGDDWMGENMHVTPKLKDALRIAYGVTQQPLAGHTYYGMYSGTSYALATFGRWPTVFRTDSHGRWRVRASTVGRICSLVVPTELLKVWSLRAVGGGCYVEPR